MNYKLNTKYLAEIIPYGGNNYITFKSSQLREIITITGPNEDLEFLKNFEGYRIVANTTNSHQIGISSIILYDSRVELLDSGLDPNDIETLEILIRKETGWREPLFIPI